MIYMQYIEQIATTDMNWYRKIIDIQGTNYATRTRCKGGDNTLCKNLVSWGLM